MKYIEPKFPVSEMRWRPSCKKISGCLYVLECETMVTCLSCFPKCGCISGSCGCQGVHASPIQSHGVPLVIARTLFFSEDVLATPHRWAARALWLFQRFGDCIPSKISNSDSRPPVQVCLTCILLFYVPLWEV